MWACPTIAQQVLDSQVQTETQGPRKGLWHTVWSGQPSGHWPSPSGFPGTFPWDVLQSFACLRRLLLGYWDPRYLKKLENRFRCLGSSIKSERHRVCLVIQRSFISAFMFVCFSLTGYASMYSVLVTWLSWSTPSISNTVDVIKIKYCPSSARKRIHAFFLLSKWLPHLPWHCLHLRTPIFFTSHNRKKMSTLNSPVDLWKGFWFHNAELLKWCGLWMISCH